MTVISENDRIATQVHSPMADVATVRAEIKAWERSFKEDNGREATIQDIKDNPAIGMPFCPHRTV